jgi:hypothetical protein
MDPRSPTGPTLGAGEPVLGVDGTRAETPPSLAKANVFVAERDLAQGALKADTDVDAEAGAALRVRRPRSPVEETWRRWYTWPSACPGWAE